MIADLVSRLIAAGTPPEIAAGVVAEAFAAGASVRGMSGGSPVDTAAEKRRAYDRARKAELRKSGGKSGGNPRTSENALSSSSSLPNSQNLEEKEKKKERASPNRGSRIPPDWRPSELHYAQGKELGIDRVTVDFKAEDMRIWAKSNEHRPIARKSNWDLTFSGWLRRSKGEANGHANGKSILAAADRLIDQHGGPAAAAAYVPGSSGPRPLEPYRLDFGEGQAGVRRLPPR